MLGFVPTRRDTFVLAKVPKTISARVRPRGGPSASAPNKMAAQLAALRQCSPKGSIRGCGSAAPEGGVKRPFDILNSTKLSTKDLTPNSYWFRSSVRINTKIELNRV